MLKIRTIRKKSFAHGEKKKNAQKYREKQVKRFRKPVRIEVLAKTLLFYDGHLREHSCPGD